MSFAVGEACGLSVVSTDLGRAFGNSGSTVGLDFAVVSVCACVVTRVVARSVIGVVTRVVGRVVAVIRLGVVSAGV